MKKSVKIGIAIGVIALLVLVLVIVFVFTNNQKEPVTNTPAVISNNIEQIVEMSPITTSRKMIKYVDILQGDYYMKYIAPTDDGTGNMIDVTIDFAIKGDSIYMNYPDTATTMLIKKEGTYYIMHDQKIIQSYPIDEEDQANYSGFQKGYTQAFFEQNYIKSGSEMIEGNELYFEEYSTNAGDGSVIRYYFNDDDEIKYIKNISRTSSELTKILVFQDQVDDSLFELPEGYTEYDLSDWSSYYAQ